ncbi:MAG: diguanylate cyclase [Planctomycetaceae bacterium]|nr:diguanylate cyclase [Planctomycetaceae bacterium]
MTFLYSMITGGACLIAGAAIGYFLQNLRRTTASWKLDSEAVDGFYRSDDGDPSSLSLKVWELAEKIEAAPHSQTKLAEIVRLVQVQTANIEQLVRDSRTDSLTGLWNRRAFDEQLPVQFNVYQRYETPLSLIMVDIDHFKQLNDNFGHPMGDEALRHLGRILRDNLRTADFAARYGGEEFVMLLPQTDLAGALATTERLREVLMEKPLITPDGPVFVKVSMGLAQARLCDNEWDLITRADQALLQAKRSGRNQIGVETGWSGALAVMEACTA